MLSSPLLARLYWLLIFLYFLRRFVFWNSFQRLVSQVVWWALILSTVIVLPTIKRYWLQTIFFFVFSLVFQIVSRAALDSVWASITVRQPTCLYRIRIVTSFNGVFQLICSINRLELLLLQYVLRHIDLVAELQFLPFLWLRDLIGGPPCGLLHLEIVIEEQLMDVAVERACFLEVLVVNVSAVGWVHSYEVTSAIVLCHGFPQQLFILGPRHLLEELLMLQELWLLFNEDVYLFN